MKKGLFALIALLMPIVTFAEEGMGLDQKIDQAFKPIVNNRNSEPNFNNYTDGRNKDDIKGLMNDIQQSRQQELNSRNQRPPTPDFLKPTKTINYITLTFVATRTGVSFEEVIGRV